ncbi:hypothetical protein ACU4GD_09615 [Cupriavidus basilensis]
MTAALFRAVRGQRDQYRPIVSGLHPGSDPVEMARAMLAHCASATLYIADLDAPHRARHPARCAASAVPGLAGERTLAGRRLRQRGAGHRGAGCAARRRCAGGAGVRQRNPVRPALPPRAARHPSTPGPAPCFRSTGAMACRWAMRHGGKPATPGRRN